MTLAYAIICPLRPRLIALMDCGRSPRAIWNYCIQLRRLFICSTPASIRKTKAHALAHTLLAYKLEPSTIIINVAQPSNEIHSQLTFCMSLNRIYIQRELDAYKDLPQMNCLCCWSWGVSICYAGTLTNMVSVRAQSRRETARQHEFRNPYTVHRAKYDAETNG